MGPIHESGRLAKPRRVVIATIGKTLPRAGRPALQGRHWRPPAGPSPDVILSGNREINFVTGGPETANPAIGTVAPASRRIGGPCPIVVATIRNSERPGRASLAIFKTR